MPPPPADVPCPGGLLCEARDRLLGWRVPVGCRPLIQRPRVASCRLSQVDIARVQEFFQSRYGVQPTPPGKFVALPRTPASVGLPPRLQARAVLQDVELLAMAGDVTAPAD